MFPSIPTDDTHASTETIARDAISILRRLVGFDTTSSESNLSLIAYVEEYLSHYEVAVKRIASSDGTKANLLATIGPRNAGGIILSGHTDVVPVIGQTWSSNPFELTERDGKLFGRGTSDMKSFLALSLACIPQLKKHTLSRPITLAFSYDEEIGCFGAPDLIRALVDDGLGNSTVIVGEPTNMTIVNSHKGMAIFEVVVIGIEAHSSLAHEGISANMAAIEILSVLSKIARDERSNHNDTRFNPPWSTLTVGTISGGTASNILARECRFTFDLRRLPHRDINVVLKPFWETIDNVRNRLKSINEQADVIVKEIASIPPLRQEPEGGAESLATMISGANSYGLAVSYGAEAGQFQNAGLSTVICGPGSISQAHKPDEFIEINQIEEGARFMARMIEYVVKH
ncbi:acetylornithine deacetylase [Hyphococcus lacteus]|uniref:Acetylornithine deacetylase n=1 Tax=Hyphococcus lacteus TaxID=3143536 RepID=A0ABV3Z354_9PROT